jgi:hypothetical protein
MDWKKYNEELVNRGRIIAESAVKIEGDKISFDVNAIILDKIIGDVIRYANPNLEHDETVDQIERVFRRHGFYTTREYPIYKIKDGYGRAGRIDLIARKGKFRIAIEYDHKYNVKYKSFQKIVQIKPDVAIGITGRGYLKSNLERASKYYNSIPLYIISLKEKRYAKL